MLHAYITICVSYSTVKTAFYDLFYYRRFREILKALQTKCKITPKRPISDHKSVFNKVPLEYANETKQP